MDYDCTNQNIGNTTLLNSLGMTTCQFVQAYCGDQTQYLDFLQLYYCDLNQNVPLIIVIAIAFVAFAFNFLGTTADAYLAPTLETISKKLKLSDAVAGVTLLALANGASDVIAGIVAGGKPAGGVTIAIGGLFGACFFTTSVVLARCIQGAGEKGIDVDSDGMKRDVFFLTIGAVYFIVCAYIGYITPPMAAVFFGIYISFLILVAIQEKRRQQLKDQVHNKVNKLKQRLIPKTMAKTEAGRFDSLVGVYMLKNHLKKQSLAGKAISAADFKFKELGQEDGDDGEPEEEEDNSCFGKFVRAYNVPLFFLRDLTMPPFESEKWNVWKAAVTPFFGLGFIAFNVGLFYYDSVVFWVVLAVISIILALMIIIPGKKENLAEKYEGTLATCAFIGSAMWINLIANFFMDFLSLISIASGLPLNYLSLSLLAWGNSMDDFFVDYVIAKNGHGKMAVTGVFAGQIFNLYLGFGGAMLRQSLNLPGNEVQLNIFQSVSDPVEAKANLLTIVLLGFLLAGLIATPLVALAKKWHIGKNMFIFLMGIYLAFFVTVSIISLA